MGMPIRDKSLQDIDQLALFGLLQHLSGPYRGHTMITAPSAPYRGHCLIQ